MMRRPLMYLTLAFSAGIAASYYLSTAAAFAAAACLASVRLLKREAAERRQNVLIMLVFGFCWGILTFAFSEMNGSCFSELANRQCELKAKVTQVDEKKSEIGGRLQIKAEVTECNGKAPEKKEIVLIDYYTYENEGEKHRTYAAESIIPGDIISVQGQLRKPEGRRNPGCFDYALYLRSIGIEMCMTAASLEVCGNDGKSSIQGRLHMLRENFLKRLEDAAGEDTAGVMRGVMFGGKDHMDEETLEEFQKNGTAHVLAVSGLHVGIIYAFIAALWRWRKGWLFLAFVMAFFMCYMAMASFSPSVVRAVFMVGLHALAKITNRRYDLSSAAFLTALLMLLKNPMHLFHTGFQMSYLAVLTLSLILPILRRFYSGLLLASISVQIGLLPYTVYIFNYLSAAAVFVNVPVIFLTGIIAPAGLCSMAVMSLWPELFELISGVIFGLCRILTQINAMTGIDGVTVFTAVSPPLCIIAVYYLSLLFFVSEDGRLAVMRKGRGYVIRAAVFIMSVSMIFGTAAGNGFKDAEVVFVDVGQGDCMHLRTGDGGNYLIDGGGSINYDLGKKTLKPYLLKNGVRRVDGAFVTHLHTDHYKGIAELCRQDMVDRLFIYEGNRVKEKQILEETGLSKSDITYLYKGQTVKLGDDAEIKVLWPERGTESLYEERAEDEEDENASSMILAADVKGCRILATADVDEACLDELTEIYGEQLGADILKAPHHGSKYSYSEAFTEASSPRYTVFQVGKNNFGHPDKGVIENYRGKGIIVCRNDENGAVAFDVGKNGGVRAMAVKGEIP